MEHTSVIDRSDIEAWLSSPRYKRYLEIAEDDDALALELYLWNIGLAQAVLRDVSFFEVALRNAYDRAISSAWNGSGHWLFDDASPVRRPILRTNKRGKVKDANRLNRNAIDHLASNLGHNPSPDKVISNLTFGFWAHMTDRSHERGNRKVHEFARARGDSFTMSEIIKSYSTSILLCYMRWKPSI
ncbi:hypothetical protein VJ918_09745 [Adlercreutzia sp. R21]|uniref:hypothetical protein n=1 Tax=Adlercreutzia wanghongyangiae TaxID=3111451 RepID=UPI002DC062FE|nr:hypothetical protein [Adlercreutzia sp. R21]MEC4185090.1 hypothetical protein [Adlercreutzia sp. R21]